MLALLNWVQLRKRSGSLNGHLPAKLDQISPTTKPDQRKAPACAKRLPWTGNIWTAHTLFPGSYPANLWIVRSIVGKVSCAKHLSNITTVPYLPHCSQTTKTHNLRILKVNRQSSRCQVLVAVAIMKRQKNWPPWNWQLVGVQVVVLKAAPTSVATLAWVPTLLWRPHHLPKRERLWGRSRWIVPCPPLY